MRLAPGAEVGPYEIQGLVGAGGMSFGPTMVNDIIHTPSLTGARLTLHDVNEERLMRAYRFAAKLNAANNAPVVLDRTTRADVALDGADFVISAAVSARPLTAPGLGLGERIFGAVSATGRAVAMPRRQRTARPPRSTMSASRRSGWPVPC